VRSQQSQQQQGRLNYFNSEEALAFLKTVTAPKSSATTISGDPLLLIKQQATAKRRIETPPTAGLAMDDSEDYEPQKPSTKFGAQTMARRTMNTSSLASGKAPPPSQAFSVFPTALGFGQIEGGFAH
jgi:hypothetical protein